MEESSTTEEYTVEYSEEESEEESEGIKYQPTVLKSLPVDPVRKSLIQTDILINIHCLYHVNVKIFKISCSFHILTYLLKGVTLTTEIPQVKTQKKVPPARPPPPSRPPPPKLNTSQEPPSISPSKRPPRPNPPPSYSRPDPPNAVQRPARPAVRPSPEVVKQSQPARTEHEYAPIIPTGVTASGEDYSDYRDNDPAPAHPPRPIRPK